MSVSGIIVIYKTKARVESISKPLINNNILYKEGEQEWMQDIGAKDRRKETTRKTKTWVVEQY
jgi:hypothetical protein